MSRNSTTYVQGGIGLPAIVTLLFVALKLTGYIGWSWWWVLSPLWISFGLWIILMVVILLIAVGATFADNRNDLRKTLRKRK